MSQHFLHRNPLTCWSQSCPRMGQWICWVSHNKPIYYQLNIISTNGSIGFCFNLLFKKGQRSHLCFYLTFKFSINLTLKSNIQSLLDVTSKIVLHTHSDGDLHLSSILPSTVLQTCFSKGVEKYWYLKRNAQTSHKRNLVTLPFLQFHTSWRNEEVKNWNLFNSKLARSFKFYHLFAALWWKNTDFASCSSSLTNFLS